MNARKMKNKPVTLTPNEGALLYLRSHPTIAAQILLGVKLNWIQRIAIKKIWIIPFVMLILGRRLGKTFIGAVSTVLFAMLYPGSRVLIVAPSKRQVDFIFINEILKFYDNSNFFRASVKGKISITNAYNRINFHNGSVIEGFPVGTDGAKARGAGCCTGDTYVLTDSGLVSVCNVIDSEKDYKIKTKKGFENVKVHVTNPKGKVYQLTTNRGRTIKGLAEHSVLVSKSRVYKKISELKEGDKVFIDFSNKWPVKKYVEIDYPIDDISVIINGKLRNIKFPKIVNEDFGFILGALSNIYIRDDNFSVGIAAKDREFAKEYREKFYNLFGVLPRVITDSSLRISVKNKPTVLYNVFINNMEITNFFESIGEYKGIIPDIILRSPRNVVISYLRGLFLSNGKIYDFNESILTLIFRLYSERLAEQLQILFSCIGYDAIIKKYSLENITYVNLYCAKALKFLKEIGIDFKPVKYIPKGFKINEYGHERISEIKYIGEEITYDFNIENEPSYFSNGFISHNSNFLWIDEYAFMSESVINLVFKPMLFVKKKNEFNRYLITSSAYYRWNHLWQLFQYYVVKMKTNPDKYFVANYNYRHLLLSDRLPVEFDMNILEEAKNTMTEEEFSMEWLACLTGDTFISTDKGLKKISEVNVGDNVLTHKGRYKKVVNTFIRDIDEDIVYIRLCYFGDLKITKNHKILVKRNDKLQWIVASEINNNDLLTFPVGNGYVFKEIEYIKYIPYKGKVYNLAIEDDNTYVSNFITVHNCFPEESKGFFSGRLVDECTPKPPDQKPVSIELKGSPNSTYYMGVDAARAEGGSNFAIAIVKHSSGKTKLVHCITANGETFQNMVKMIRDRFLKFNISEIRMDAGGGGTTLLDLLGEEFVDYSTGKKIEPLVEKDSDKKGIKVIRMVNIGAEKHNSLHMNLKSEMEHKRLLLPISIRRDKDKDIERVGQEIAALKTEMQVMQAIPKGQYLRFEVPKRFRTDRVMALALALDCIIDQNKNTEIYPDELPVGSWVSFN